MGKKGAKLSAATRAKMSSARMGHSTSAETRAKIGAANRGKKRSLEIRAAMSLSHAEASRRPETMEKHRSVRAAWWLRLTPEKRAALAAARSIGQKARWARLTIEERRALLAPAVTAAAPVVRQIWRDMSPEDKLAKLRPIWTASQSANPSSIEETVARLLDSLGVAYQRQVFIGSHLVDFWLRDKKLVIECDGSYWHNLPGRPEQDAARDAWMRSRGFSVLRLPEPLIRSGAAAATLAEIAS